MQRRPYHQGFGAKPGHNMGDLTAEGDTAAPGINSDGPVQTDIYSTKSVA
jgi:hypothetical protein